jgi:Rad3-related DNA helicase
METLERSQFAMLESPTGYPRHHCHVITITSSLPRHNHHVINNTSSPPRHHDHVIIAMSSPLGTGKTLCLLCTVLAWQKKLINSSKVCDSFEF